MLIVDGTLVPTRDHTIAERSKNSNSRLGTARLRSYEKISTRTPMELSLLAEHQRGYGPLYGR